MFLEHPKAVFTIDITRPLPSGFADGDSISTNVTGSLSIRGIEKRLSFDIEARDDGDVIFLLGRTTFVWADFGMTAPSAPTVVSVDEEVKVEVLLELKPLPAS